MIMFRESFETYAVTPHENRFDEAVLIRVTTYVLWRGWKSILYSPYYQFLAKKIQK